MPWPKLRKQPPTEKPDKPAPAKPAQTGAEQRLQKLARKLDAIPAKDAQRIAAMREVERRQAEGVAHLHQLCREFVDRLNRMLTNIKIDLSPPQYVASVLKEGSGILIQINASGRVMQISLPASEPVLSTEHFRIPYILEGRARWFNQELLDRQEIQEQHLFYCVERGGDGWRRFDPRSRESARLTQDFLAEALDEIS